MSGRKGMRWKKLDKFDYPVYSSLTKKQHEKLLTFCEQKKWNISQAVRNILFWFFEKEKTEQRNINVMLDDLWEQERRRKND